MYWICYYKQKIRYSCNKPIILVLCNQLDFFPQLMNWFTNLCTQTYHLIISFCKNYEVWKFFLSLMVMLCSFQQIYTSYTINYNSLNCKQWDQYFYCWVTVYIQCLILHHPEVHSGGTPIMHIALS